MNRKILIGIISFILAATTAAYSKETSVFAENQRPDCGCCNKNTKCMELITSLWDSGILGGIATMIVTIVGQFGYSSRTLLSHASSSDAHPVLLFWPDPLPLHDSEITR